MNYTVYNPATGQIELVFTSQDAVMAQQNLQNRTWITGNYSSIDYYIVDGQPVNKPTKPTVLGQVFDFDYATKSWTINSDRTAQASRQLRNSQLSIVDRINPVWYATLTPEQQTELAQYRQALLDVPQQSGWPNSITWPRQPAWL